MNYAFVEGTVRGVVGLVRPWLLLAGAVLAMLTLARLCGVQVPYVALRASLTDMAMVSALLVWAGR